MVAIAWTLVVAAVLLGCLGALQLERSLGRKFLNGACYAAPVTLGPLSFSYLLWGPFGGSAEVLWFALECFVFATILTAAVRLFKTR